MQNGGTSRRVLFFKRHLYLFNWFFQAFSLLVVFAVFVVCVGDKNKKRQALSSLPFLHSREATLLGHCLDRGGQAALVA